MFRVIAAPPLSLQRRLAYALLVCSITVLAIWVVDEIVHLLCTATQSVACEMRRLLELFCADPMGACLAVCQYTEAYYIHWCFSGSCVRGM